MGRTFEGIGSMGNLELPNAIAALCGIVFGILKGYWLLFLRAINFVSRRQEFRADELACYVAGPAALTGGLRAVRASAMAWPSYWNNELAPMLNAGCLPSISGGFSQFLAAPSVAKDVEDGIEKNLREAKTEAYDSHPPLRDRVAAASKLSIPSPEDDLRPACSLMSDISAVELNFLKALNPDLPTNAFRHVSWEESAHMFLIPTWTQSVSEYAPLLENIRSGNLPQSKDRLLDIASKMRDPKGMLLTPAQRVPYAANLVASAFALALVRNGWTVHSSPGELYLEKDGKQIQPFERLIHLYKNDLSDQAWAEQCGQDGIGDFELILRQKGAHAGEQRELATR